MEASLSFFPALAKPPLLGMRLVMDTGLNGQMERRWTGGLEREDSTRGMLKDRDGDTETVFLWSEKGEMPVFPHSCYSVSNLSLHRGVPRGQISTDR